jgi:PPK2 family polyphosphate:nucleotide phosphotransferase
MESEKSVTHGKPHDIREELRYSPTTRGDPMPMKFSKELAVKPGHKVKLSRWDPDDTLGWEKDRETRENLDKAIERLIGFQYRLYAEKKRALLLIFQGLDAAGKDGTIRHVMSGVDPQGCIVKSFKVPSTEEASHDFLWRVHKAVPGCGEIGVFNRSHYEDVLIVRVHNLVPKDVWSRRYNQINDFEAMLEENRVKILKFFLHISKDEQKKRFMERIDDPDKRRRFSGTEILGRLYRGLPGRVGALHYRRGALVHHSRQQKMVPQPCGIAHYRRDVQRDGYQVSAAYHQFEEAEVEVSK